MRSQPTCQRRRDRFNEENPHMPAMTGAGALKRCRNTACRTGLKEGSSVISPSRLIKIGGKKPACLVRQHWIDAAHRLSAVAILPHPLVYGLARMRHDCDLAAPRSWPARFRLAPIL